MGLDIMKAIKRALTPGKEGVTMFKQWGEIVQSAVPTALTIAGLTGTPLPVGMTQPSGMSAEMMGAPMYEMAEPTWIPGVPNWAVIAGGAGLAALILLRRR